MAVTKFCIFIFAVLILTSHAQAEIIVTASGTNTFVSDEFFFVEVDSLPNGLTVDQISIDLQGGTDPDDVWDTNQPGGNAPWGFVNGTGINSGDVTFGPAPGAPFPHGSVLDIFFAAGTFGEGDSFSFVFDTDFTITDGDEFGEFGVTVDLLLSDGRSISTAFVNDGIFNDTSAATFAIPEPAQTSLLALAVIGFLMRRRRS